MSEHKLISAIRKHDNSQVEQLLCAGNVSPDVFSMPANGFMTALMWAVAEENEFAVKALIAAGADLDIRDEDGCSALMHAIGSPALLKHLITAGAELNFTRYSDKKNALMLAAMDQDVECLDVLLDAKPDLNQTDNDGRSALLLSIDKDLDDLRAFNKIIQAGADLEVKDNNGFTVLFALIMRGLHDHAGIILEAGANVHAVDPQNWTPLMWAATASSREGIQLLLEYGASIEATDSSGRTAIFHAIDSALPRENRCLKKLIDAKANINHQDHRGVSPLMLAVAKLAIDAFQSLMDAGADPDLIDKLGQSASDHANENKKKIGAGAHFVKFFNDYREKQHLQHILEESSENSEVYSHIYL